MSESRAGLMTIRGTQATARIGLGTLVVARAPLFIHRIEPIAGYRSAATRTRPGPAADHPSLVAASALLASRAAP